MECNNCGGVNFKLCGNDEMKINKYLTFTMDMECSHCGATKEFRVHYNLNRIRKQIDEAIKKGE